jgi:hypothetical protein
MFNQSEKNDNMPPSVTFLIKSPGFKNNYVIVLEQKNEQIPQMSSYNISMVIFSRLKVY